MGRNGPDHFKLEGKTPVPVDTSTDEGLFAWAEWFGTADRTVRLTILTGGVTVSTVFISLNHNYGAGPPLLFETAIIRSGDFDIVARYSTWNEAEAGHAATVATIQSEESRTVEREVESEADLLSAEYLET